MGDVKALLVLLGICFAATLLATLISAAITRLTRVDMESSMKLSRSAYEVRMRLVEGKRSGAELLGYEQMMRCSDEDGICNAGDIGSPGKGCSYSALELSDCRDVSLDDSLTFSH